MVNHLPFVNVSRAFCGVLPAEPEFRPLSPFSPTYASSVQTRWAVIVLMPRA